MPMCAPLLTSALVVEVPGSLRLQPRGRDGSIDSGRLCVASSAWPGHDARTRSGHLQTSRSSPSTSPCHRALLWQYGSMMLRGVIAARGNYSRAHRCLVWVSGDDRRTPEHCAPRLSRSRLGSLLSAHALESSNKSSPSPAWCMSPWCPQSMSGVF